MIRLPFAAALLCVSTIACVAAQKNPNDFLEGIRSIEVVMHRVPASPKRATPDKSAPEVCTASQYGVGDGYHGRRTADGSIFNTYADDPYTVAHIKRRLGSWVKVTSLANGKSIRARVTDRGPFYHGRCVDLGRAGANALGMGGTARVRVE